MRKFIFKQIIFPLSGRWLKGLLLLLIWTISFIALPAISGWFLASCSLAFITANTFFTYLIPSSSIRLLALIRTATRYFERINNHKTTLQGQQRLQLKIFQSVAQFPYFKKQVNKNSAILENSTYGIDMILNHILLWILPFTTLVIAMVIYFFFLNLFSTVIALEFLIASAVILFFIPQFVLLRNRKIYAQLKLKREENNQTLMQSFRGRIEISKYNLEEKALRQEEKSKIEIERLERKIQHNSFTLQMLVGLGFGCVATFIFWHSGNFHFDAPLAIGVFFGILTQGELAEIVFSGKSEKSSAANQVKDISSILNSEGQANTSVVVGSKFAKLSLQNLQATIPETSMITQPISIDLQQGDWIALYGETGKGKTTFLNSLFYPEYRHKGSIFWNDEEIAYLPVPEAVYVTQKAYLLTGTLRENFQEYDAQHILQILETVDLTNWYHSLQNGLDAWIGENGETLSGGQRKKLLLAQALLKKPQLLVVDEPTAGISTDNAIEIFKNIKKQYPDMTILMCTHLKDFEKEVDRVLAMN